jgi:hypothetical protein
LHGTVSSMPMGGKTLVQFVEDQPLRRGAEQLEHQPARLRMAQIRPHLRLDCRRMPPVGVRHVRLPGGIELGIDPLA